MFALLQFLEFLDFGWIQNLYHRLPSKFLVEVGAKIVVGANCAGHINDIRALLDEVPGLALQV